MRDIIVALAVVAAWSAISAYIVGTVAARYAVGLFADLNAVLPF